jgi:phospholipid/cholesterol/gamma-HCH transport system substrate-binding protein
METTARYGVIGVFTIGVIATVFTFIYWLHNTGGLGKRSVYQILFESPVSGLLVGSGVLFNGIRVGEVTGLQISPENPRQVRATVSIDASAPVRRDTVVGMDFQGLTGAPAIQLTGGDASSPAFASDNGNTPLLKAPPSAGPGLSQAARETLGRLDKVLVENSDSLRDAIGDIGTFSKALARNSGRVDGILAGLERMTAGTTGKAKLPVIDFAAAHDLPACAVAPSGQLVVPEPSALMVFNSDKIVVASAASGAPAFDTAQFSDTIPAVIQSKIIDSFQSSGCFEAVSRPLDGLVGDYVLAVDIRDFRISMSPQPVATVAFAVSIMAGADKIAASRSFLETAPLDTVDTAGAMAALNTAFGKTMRELVIWADHNRPKPAAP